MGHLSGPHDHSITVVGGSVLLEFPKHLKKRIFRSLCNAWGVYEEKYSPAKVLQIDVFVPGSSGDPFADADCRTRFTFKPRDGKCEVKVSYEVNKDKERPAWYQWLRRCLYLFTREKPNLQEKVNKWNGCEAFNVCPTREGFELSPAPKLDQSSLQCEQVGRFMDAHR